MKIRTCCFFLFLACCFMLPDLMAQRRKIDSLVKLLPQRSDTAKVKIYLKLANGYRRISIDTAIHYALTALEQAKKYKHIRYEYDAVFKLGDFNREKGNFQESHAYLQRSLAIGVMLNDTLGMAQTYNSIGNTYNKQGDYPKALNFFLRSLEIKEKLGDKHGMSNTYINIGNVYDHLSAYNKSEEYILKGARLKEELGDYYGVAGALNNLSIIYTRRYQPEKSVSTLEKVLKDYSQYADPYLRSAVLGNLAEAYQALKKTDKALAAAKEGLQIRLDLGDSTNASYSFITLANIEYDLKNYKEVINYATHALQMSERIGLLNHVWDAHISLGEAYSAMGDPNKALYHYRKAMALNDTLANNKANDAVHEMEAKYESDKKEAEITKLNDQKKIQELELEKKEADIGRQRVFMIFGTLLILCMIAVSVMVYRSYRLKKRSNEKLQAAYNTIEEKQKEILDSIRYAKRIQNSLLPSEKYIHKHTIRN